MNVGEILPAEPMPQAAFEAIESMESVQQAGVTDRLDCGCITGYVVVTDGVVAHFRFWSERDRWRLVAAAPATEVSEG